MQNVRIRPMIDSDVERKGYVHLKSCLETYEGLMDPEVVAGWTLEVYQAIARRFVANTIVAELDSKIVGFGCWDPAGGDFCTVCVTGGAGVRHRANAHGCPAGAVGRMRAGKAPGFGEQRQSYRIL